MKPRAIFSWPAYLQMHSLLHPLRLVVSTKINTTKQDRFVKVHINIVPEWTKWVTILKMVENSLNGRKARLTVQRRHIDLRGWTDGLNQAETHLHWTGFLISSSLGSSLKAIGSPLSWQPVFGSQRLHEVLQTDHSVIRWQGLQLEELPVRNMDLNTTNAGVTSLFSLIIVCKWTWTVVKLSHCLTTQLS